MKLSPEVLGWAVSIGVIILIFVVKRLYRQRIDVRAVQDTPERRQRTQKLLRELSQISGTPKEQFEQLRKALAEWPLVVGKYEGPVYAVMRTDEMEQVLRALPSELGLREVARVYFESVTDGSFEEVFLHESDNVLEDVFPHYDFMLPSVYLIAQRKPTNFSTDDLLEMAIEYAGRILPDQIDDFLYLFEEWQVVMSHADQSDNPWRDNKLKELREVLQRLRPSEEQLELIESIIEDAETIKNSKQNSS